MEIWKPVPKYHDLLLASSFGRIKMCSRTIYFTHAKTKQRHIRKTKERVLPQYIGPTGYLIVGFMIDGKSKQVPVHRLVSHAFHGYSDLDVHHIDHNKLNNNLENLEQLSATMHRKRSWAEQQLNNDFLKQSISKYTLNNIFIKNYIGINEAARVNGVHPQNICACLSGKQKQTGGFIWKRGTFSV